MPTALPNCVRRALRRNRFAVRLVLDTNVWLDWLVFDDAGVAAIKAAVANRQAEIFIDDACACELASVLGYRLRKTILTAEEQAACMNECRRIAANDFAAVDILDAGPLPVCRDTDDQKFLELARACAADFLVTKDRLLLVLDRRKIRRAPFRIATPQTLASRFAG
ncbi:MAG: nucleotide-binding protein [Betaproteobacteria bacterium]|nr:nucleotide-binding protein [Betaproteobacteria bacterium]